MLPFFENERNFKPLSPQWLNSKMIFVNLLTYFQDKKEELKIVFKKNRELLKESIRIKIDKELPNFTQTHQMYDNLYCHSKAKIQTNCSTKSKTLFLWLISAQEAMLKKNFESFTTMEWQTIAECIPNTSVSQLKYRLFSYLERKSSNKIWNSEQEDILKGIMRKLYPNLFQSPQSTKGKIKWTLVSIEFCKELDNVYHFKINKQCKERWFNHLNPFVNKKLWNLEEDIKLLSESLVQPNKWAQIARSFPGRNQHQIKNRFICIISKEVGHKRDQIRQIIKDNSIMNYIHETLKSLKLKQQKRTSCKQEEHKEIEENLKKSEKKICQPEKKETESLNLNQNLPKLEEVQQGNQLEMVNNVQNLFEYENYMINLRFQLQFQFALMAMASFFPRNIMQPKS